MAGIFDSHLSEIKSLKEEIRRAERSEESINKRFLILAVERFFVDPRYKSFIKSDGIAGDSAQDGYDLTLTDGEFKLKCVLARKFNRAIQKGEILSGKVISIRQCSLLYDEEDLNGLHFILIQEAEFLDLGQNARSSLRRIDAEIIQWSPSSYKREKSNLPLISNRGCYTWTWSPYETYGEIWHETVLVSKPLSNDTAEELYTLRELSKQWRSLKLSAYPPLLVRVLNKSRLRHYAKPHKSDKWPYQVYMVIGDRSGSCCAVIWNSLCAKLYHSIQQGSVLLLENYTVKPHFSVYNDHPRSKVSELVHYDIDVNLNPHHPEARVTLIHHNAVVEDLELPPLQYEFVTRSQLGSLPDNFICDVVGVVRCVGRYERITPASSGHVHAQNDDRFWVIRRLELVDQAFSQTGKSFNIKLFRSVHGQTVDDLYPGQVVLCSPLRVVIGDRSNSKQTVFPYLTSTAETQITVIKEDMVKDFCEPIISELTNWLASNEGHSAVREAAIGGYFSYPPLPCDLGLYKQLYTDKFPMKIIPSSEWSALLGCLSLRESKPLIVQAFLVKVSHHYQPRDRAEKKKKPLGLTFKEAVKFEQADESLTNVTVFGSSILETETLPYKTENRNKEKLLQRMAFPPSVFSKDSFKIGQDDLPVSINEEFSYFSVTLMGLNQPVAIKALQLHQQLPKDFNLQDVLSRRASESSELNREERRELASRWLCHLDLYQIDKDRTEIILNTAYPLS